VAKILCVGILVSDTIVKPVYPEIFSNDTMRVDAVEQSTGGDAMNQAVVLRRLGNHVGLAGIVGRGRPGAELVERLSRGRGYPPYPKERKSRHPPPAS
jgi:sugar/nucleoside kinase (ribokinase family)